MSCLEMEMLRFRAFIFALHAYSQRAVWKQCWFYTGFTPGIFRRMLLCSSALRAHSGTAAPAPALGRTEPGSWHLLQLPWYLLGSEGPAPCRIRVRALFSLLQPAAGCFALLARGDAVQAHTNWELVSLTSESRKSG